MFNVAINFYVSPREFRWFYYTLPICNNHALMETPKARRIEDRQVIIMAIHQPALGLQLLCNFIRSRLSLEAVH